MRKHCRDTTALLYIPISPRVCFTAYYDSTEYTYDNLPLNYLFRNRVLWDIRYTPSSDDILDSEDLLDTFQKARGDYSVIYRLYRSYIQERLVCMLPKDNRQIY